MREPGETWAVDPASVVPIGDVLDPLTAELCRHIDEVGESLGPDLRGVAVLIAQYGEQLERRFAQRAKRLDRLEGRILALETRPSSLEGERKPRRPRRR